MHSARLSADLEPESAYDVLNLIWSRRVSLCMMKYHCKHKRADVLFDGHPFISQQDAYVFQNMDTVMVIIHQLLRLLARTNGNRLIWVDLIKV